jgi:molybdate transport system permease protein
MPPVLGLFASDVDLFPLWLSLRVAALATAMTVVTGLAIAYLLSHKRFPGRDLVDAFFTLPLVLPPTVLGYFLLVLLSRHSALGGLWERVTGGPLVFTWQAAVVAAFVHSAPLFIKAARAALEEVNYRYEWAARSLGASEWITFLRITLPLAARSLLALGSLCFARSLGDFGVTIMLAGDIPDRTQTLSVAIYDAVESGNGALARVLVLIVSALALSVLWLANYWIAGRETRQAS